MSARRLRSGEWLAALGAVVVLVDLFAVRWYGPHGRHGLTGWWSYPPLSVSGYGPGHHPTRLLVTGATGWQAIPTLRWFVLVSAVLGLALALAQAAVRGPALPVSLDLVAWLIASLTTALVLIRLATTGAPLRFGAVLGLLGVGAVAGGAFAALRSEQGWAPGPERPVELVDLH